MVWRASPPVSYTHLDVYKRQAKGQLGVAGDNTWGAGPHAEYHVALEKGETFRFTFGGMGGNG